MAMPTPEEMRARFHSLTAQKNTIEAQAAPIRAKYETLRQQQLDIAAAIQPLVDQMRTAEAPLYAIDVERAQLSRALNGRTGEPS